MDALARKTSRGGGFVVGDLTVANEPCDLAKNRNILWITRQNTAHAGFEALTRGAAGGDGFAP